MNTWRKLMYSFLDILIGTGIRPWLSKEFFVAASGDDGVTMGSLFNLLKVQKVKLQISDPDIVVRGLGQIIKEAPITESWNFDFCSKLVLKDHDVFYGRALLKVLT